MTLQQRCVNSYSFHDEFYVFVMCVDLFKNLMFYAALIQSVYTYWIQFVIFIFIVNLVISNISCNSIVGMLLLIYFEDFLYRYVCV